MLFTNKLWVVQTWCSLQRVGNKARTNTLILQEKYGLLPQVVKSTKIRGSTYPQSTVKYYHSHIIAIRPAVTQPCHQGSCYSQPDESLQIKHKRLWKVSTFPSIYYYRNAVHHKNLSLKFDRFLAVRSPFDTVHGVNFVRLHVAYLRPLWDRFLRLSFVFLRQKIRNNFATDAILRGSCHIDVATAAY